MRNTIRNNQQFHKLKTIIGFKFILLFTIFFVAKIKLVAQDNKTEYTYNEEKIGKSKISKIYDKILELDKENSTKEIDAYQKKYGYNSPYYHYLKYKYQLEFNKKDINKLDSAHYHLQQAYKIEKIFELCEKINFCKENYTLYKDNLEKEIFELVKNNDDQLTSFLIKYPNSVIYDQAFNYQTEKRFNLAKETNTLNSITEFIEKNPLAKEIPEAIIIQAKLAYKKLENNDQIKDHKEYLFKYPKAPIFYITKIKNKIKTLEYQQIEDLFISSQKKYKELISDFYNNENGLINLNLDLRVNENSLSYINLNKNNINFSPANEYNKILILIKNFFSNYPNSFEAINLIFLKKEIEKIAEEFDFYSIMYAANNIRDLEKEKELWNWYVNNHKNLNLKFLAAEKLESNEALVESIIQFNENIQRRNEEKQRLLAEEMQRKKEEELELKRNPFKKAVSLLSEKDKNYFQSIINRTDDDPQNKNGKHCGTGVSNCKWCEDSFTYPKVYKSRISLLQQYNSPMGEYAGVMLGLGLALQSAFSGEDPEKIPLEFKNQILNLLQQIKNGNIYSCEGSVPDFCSKKCQFEYSLIN